MSPVEFEENNYTYTSRKILGEPEKPKMVGYLLNTGIIKNEYQASRVLLGISLGAILLTMVILYFTYSPKPVPPANAPVSEAIKEMTRPATPK